MVLPILVTIIIAVSVVVVPANVFMDPTIAGAATRRKWGDGGEFSTFAEVFQEHRSKSGR